MKITGIILIVFGSLLLFINLVSMIFGSSDPTPHFEGIVHKISFYIGYNIFNILGFVLLIVGIFLRRKAKRKRTNKDLINSLLENQIKQF